MACSAAEKLSVTTSVIMGGVNEKNFASEFLVVTICLKKGINGCNKVVKDGAKIYVGYCMYNIIELLDY